MKLTCSFLVFFFWMPVLRPCGAQDLSTRYHNKMGVVNYATTYAVPPVRDPLFLFQADRYQIFLGGGTTTLNSADAIQSTYRDMSYLYLNQAGDLKAVAEQHGYNYEDMLLHMKVNHTFTDDRFGWSGVGRFDGCESWSGDTGSKGVFLVNAGSVYVDATSAAWNTTAADVPITSSILLGYCEPFDEVRFQFSTPASSGISVKWEYWNGYFWTSLPMNSDTTNGMKQDGTVRFWPVGTWKTKAENGSKPKWWVRASVRGTGTTPVASRVLADDWSVPGQANTWRGWDSTSPTRANVGVGALEYNPTPPAGASARFRYQARLGGVWTKNVMLANPADTQRGERTWVRYLIDLAYPQLSSGLRNTIFFDDADARPAAISSPASWQDYTELAGRDLSADRRATYTDTRAYLRSRLPAAKTCINTAVWSMASQGECFLVELAGNAYLSTYYWEVRTDKNYWNSASYDQLLPQNNPTGVKGIYVTWDTASDFMLNGTWLNWDRGNRGPIAALASYYTLANENTLFGYNTEQGWLYYKTDEFSYIDAAPNFSTSRAVTSDMTSAVKYVHGNFAAFPAANNVSSKALNVRIGNTGEYLPVWKVSDSQLATTDLIANVYPAHTPVYLVREGHLVTDPLPPLQQMVVWSKWFPAIQTDIGVPDTAGYNGGMRDLKWKSPQESGTLGGFSRRDFTRAVVIHAPGMYYATADQVRAYGNTIALGGTYYPLLANGRTAPGVTSIRLRSGEGAILMKQPIL